MIFHLILELDQAPGLMITILFCLLQLFIAKFFVYFEFAIIFSELFNTFTTLLFNELPTG